MEEQEKVLEGNSKHDKLLDFCSNYSNIYLYGANKVGGSIAKFLTCKGLCVKGFLETEEYKEKEYLDIPVYNFSDTAINAKSDGIIICIIREDGDEPEIKRIREELIRMGYKSNVYVQEIYKKISILQNTIQPDAPDGYKGYFKDCTELNKIGMETGTDKANFHHNYLRKYEHFLSKFKNSEFTLLELGVFKGASLEMWSRYFPKARIVGTDYDKKCLQYTNDKKEVILADLSNTEEIEKLCDLHPTVIIDDASHIWSHQIKALFTLYKALPHGGIYIIEDIETSFWIGSGYEDTAICPYDICDQIAAYVTSGGAQKPTGALSDKIEETASQTEMAVFLCGSCILIKN